MKLLIDINHPAHVHYFKNMMRIMRKKGDEFVIVSRHRFPCFELLEALGEKYINRGKGKNSSLGKLFYMLWADLRYIFIILKHRPDLIISFSTPYPHQVSRLFGIPNIAINDTEHAKLHKKFTYPFASAILTPACFQDELGPKQVRFNSYMELTYLHPNYFSPNEKIYQHLDIDKSQKFIILRFVSWQAHHDVGQGGIPYEEKFKLVEALIPYARIFISSEGELPTELQKYAINIPFEMMHDALAFASLFVGEGGTMASEAAVLGTPAIYVNSLSMGYLTEEAEYGLLYHFKKHTGFIDKALELMNNQNLAADCQTKRQKLLKNKIDPTAFFVDYINNFI